MWFPDVSTVFDGLLAAGLVGVVAGACATAVPLQAVEVLEGVGWEAPRAERPVLFAGIDGFGCGSHLGPVGRVLMAGTGPDRSAAIQRLRAVESELDACSKREDGPGRFEVIFHGEDVPASVRGQEGPTRRCLLEVVRHWEQADGTRVELVWFSR